MILSEPVPVLYLKRFHPTKTWLTSAFPQYSIYKMRPTAGPSETIVVAKIAGQLVGRSYFPIFQKEKLPAGSRWMKEGQKNYNRVRLGFRFRPVCEACIHLVCLFLYNGFIGLMLAAESYSLSLSLSSVWC